MKKAPLNYDPKSLPRELKKYYISASEAEIQEMFKEIGLSKREQLFEHIPEELRFKETPKVCKHLEYDQLIEHVNQLADKNNIRPSFIGDGLKWYKVHPIVPFVCDIRGLTTAYTPYQPERSQGTLQTLWLYSSTLSMLTGFEAINASFYERSTCLFEAINTAVRIKKTAKSILISEGLYPEDIRVVESLAKETKLNLLKVPLDLKTGLTDQKKLAELIKQTAQNLAAVIYPQSNCLGLLEDVHTLTNQTHDNNSLAISVIDPMLLGQGGLIPPSQYGKKGADMIVGEGQHLAIGPNFGGPGLGIFGIRYNQDNKNAIRSTAGRFIGKGVDSQGQECLTMVLSTREQHIRREKATSNICSNQSFLATIAGAGILARGEEGLRETLRLSKQRACDFLKFTQTLEGVSHAYPDASFYNELILEVSDSSKDLIKQAARAGLHIGVSVNSRVDDNRELILMYFNDAQTEEDIQKLKSFFQTRYSSKNESIQKVKEIPNALLRQGEVGLPKLETSAIEAYYTKLGEQNVSPDDDIYPLGSCTMKYNPYINDYAASLRGFTDLHPQAPESDCQGSLEILYQTQEYFKGITGLSAVTTQPVAGAQGELVGIKLFQAYHRDKGNAEKKNILIIPKSAHGTNPATATMAGFETKLINGVQHGIVTINADELGQIDIKQFNQVMDQYNDRVAGIMITNPNTSGIFEIRFKEIAKRIHDVDGLVYMDGANMNAIASWIDLGAMGVDAVHNNLHKTWTIPHGGGGPGDAIVAVSEKLVDYLPGMQIQLKDGNYNSYTPSKTIGTFHRHWGNFAHKVRAYTYLRALGDEGVREMSAIAVLSAKYLYHKLKNLFPTLPLNAENEARMHEFIITLNKDSFDRIQNAGVPKAQAIAKVGKLFLDFGLHAPTVAFPEQFGLMIEPTESFDKKELDRFLDILTSIHQVLNETPQVLTTSPHFTPIRKVDEVSANKNLVLSEQITGLTPIRGNIISPEVLKGMETEAIVRKIREAHEKES